MKNHVRKDLLSSKFYDKCKEGYLGHFRMSWKILEGQPIYWVYWNIYWINTAIIFFWPHLHQSCFMLNFIGRVVGLTTWNILRTTRDKLMNFCIVNTPRCQILILGCIVFCLFQVFDSEKVIPKNKLNCEIKCEIIITKSLQVFLHVIQDELHRQDLVNLKC